MNKKLKIIIQYFGGVGSITNAICTYHFWVQTSLFWSWTYLILGGVAAPICLLDLKDKCSESDGTASKQDNGSIPLLPNQ